MLVRMSIKTSTTKIFKTNIVWITKCICMHKMLIIENPLYTMHEKLKPNIPYKRTQGALFTGL